MQLSRAAKFFVHQGGDRGAEPKRPAPIDHNLIERAAEALYEFVFSGCDRLDGKRRWEHCSEETKEGFRREASAVLEAVLPVLFPREIKSSQVGKRQIRAAFRNPRIALPASPGNHAAG
jgi:hypothetical protein